MNVLFFARAVALTLTSAGPTFAADMPRGVLAPSFAAPFGWTGCYLGAHLGGGWAHKDLTDPVQLVQDSFLGAGSTTGITTANTAPRGVAVGGQIGCDYQFAPTWVVGIEGANIER